MLLDTSSTLLIKYNDTLLKQKHVAHPTSKNTDLQTNTHYAKTSKLEQSKAETNEKRYIETIVQNYKIDLFTSVIRKQ